MMITFPDEFVLKNPYINGFENEDDPLAISYIKERNEIARRILEGTMYVKFISGDREGSIAKIFPDPTYGKLKEATIGGAYRSWDHNIRYAFYDTGIWVICKWDKRSNKPKLSIPDRDIVLLPNYDGPTIWNLFDKNSAKKEILKSPDQYDIDGNLLNIGDKVLYINARYGSGMELQHGKIIEFKVVVDSRKTEIKTVVKSDVNGIISTINYPETMIYKKPSNE